jgi:hypothetical protein
MSVYNQEIFFSQKGHGIYRSIKFSLHKQFCWWPSEILNLKSSNTVRPRYQAIPISANFVIKLFSIVSQNTHRVLFFDILTH